MKDTYIYALYEIIPSHLLILSNIVLCKKFKKDIATREESFQRLT